MTGRVEAVGWYSVTTALVNSSLEKLRYLERLLKNQKDNK
jgi:hypothetical protein